MDASMNDGKLEDCENARPDASICNVLNSQLHFWLKFANNMEKKCWGLSSNLWHYPGLLDDMGITNWLR